MTPKLDAWGIVIAGHWNRMIFTPEWVSENLFQQDVIETEIALLPILPVIYRHQQVVLEVSLPRLVFRPRFNTGESISEAEKMANIVLRALPNTPLMGVGINYSFVESEPNLRLVDLFNLGDSKAIAREEWTIPETKIWRKLTKEQETLNLSLAYDGALSIDVNFHAETPGKTAVANKAALDALENRSVRLRDMTIDFLATVYELKLDKGEHDE